MSVTSSSRHGEEPSGWPGVPRPHVPGSIGAHSGDARDEPLNKRMALQKRIATRQIFQQRRTSIRVKRECSSPLRYLSTGTFWLVIASSLARSIILCIQKICFELMKIWRLPPMAATPETIRKARWLWNECAVKHEPMNILKSLPSLTII